MLNYNNSLPHIYHCYGITKVLNIINVEYEELQEISSFDSFIDIHKINAQQIEKGILLSNKLINTPIYINYKTTYKLESYLAKAIKFIKTDNMITAKLVVNNNILATFEDIQSNLKWLYYYTYLLRQGFSVVEQKGLYYNVIEPLGTIYRIDTYNCSCTEYLNNKNCLHHKLIEWYQKSKHYL